MTRLVYGLLVMLFSFFLIVSPSFAELYSSNSIEANPGFKIEGSRQDLSKMTEEEKTKSLLNLGWSCGCDGTCYNGLSYGATGYGGTIGSAISDCERKLRNVCAFNDDGLQTYSGDICDDV